MSTGRKTIMSKARRAALVLLIIAACVIALLDLLGSVASVILEFNGRGGTTFVALFENSVASATVSVGDNSQFVVEPPYVNLIVSPNSPKRGSEGYFVNIVALPWRPVPADRYDGTLYLALSFRHLWLMVILALALVFSPWVYSGIRRFRRKNQGRCMNCGYDLRASSGKCPECGVASTD